VSLPAIATIGLFTIIGHWNAWFDGILIFELAGQIPAANVHFHIDNSNERSDDSPLTVEQSNSLENLSEKTLRTAQIFMGALPILMLIYPFVQRYFIKGITVGSAGIVAILANQTT
jgi:putative aldouronate transport system permease protein